MEWQIALVVGLIVLIPVMIYFSREKCPKCHKRGGVHTRYKARYEGKRGNGKAYDVQFCDKCGSVISERYLGETHRGSNL